MHIRGVSDGFCVGFHPNPHLGNTFPKNPFMQA